MVYIPQSINGASVLQYAVRSSPEGYGVIQSEKEGPSVVSTIAICRYAQDDSINVFLCNSSFKVLKDYNFSSIEDAIEFVVDEFSVKNWNSFNK